ncbi:nucleoid-associated protein [Pseudomonas sp. USHLN015]|uniref:nucleoid-associated protein n=1 Tax=Pseudomonas sp. USHLN015 TaxID=3081296 RepID=UPI00301BA980
MAYELKFAVIHSFEKAQHTIVVRRDTIVEKPLFDVKIPTVQALVTGIHELLGKPENNVIWGQFSDSRPGPFPNTVKSLLTTPNAKNFESLAKTALHQLIGQAKEEPLSTGGHTLFAHYISNSIPYLLIANIKQRNGLRLGEDYIPIESVDIDMTKVQQAARINLSRLSESLLPTTFEGDENIEENNDRTYLCFISKGRDSDASTYFIKALGCEKGVASGRATNNAIDVVEAFFRGIPELRPISPQAKENVIIYLRERLEKKEKATLRGVKAAAASAIPAEIADHATFLDSLDEQLNNEENRVPEEFTVNKVVLNRKTKIKSIANRWTLQFEKGALGTTANSTVFYNENEGTITLKDLPPKLIKDIAKEIKDRNAG